MTLREEVPKMTLRPMLDGPDLFALFERRSLADAPAVAAEAAWRSGGGSERLRLSELESGTNAVDGAVGVAVEATEAVEANEVTGDEKVMGPEADGGTDEVDGGGGWELGGAGTWEMW